MVVLRNAKMHDADFVLVKTERRGVYWYWMGYWINRETGMYYNDKVDEIKIIQFKDWFIVKSKDMRSSIDE